MRLTLAIIPLVSSWDDVLMQDSLFCFWLRTLGLTEQFILRTADSLVHDVMQFVFTGIDNKGSLDTLDTLAKINRTGQSQSQS